MVDSAEQYFWYKANNWSIDNGMFTIRSTDSLRILDKINGTIWYALIARVKRTKNYTNIVIINSKIELSPSPSSAVPAEHSEI